LAAPIIPGAKAAISAVVLAIVKARLRYERAGKWAVFAKFMVPPYGLLSAVRTPFFVVVSQNLPNIDTTYHMLLKDCANL
jgi:hypothetical protein